MTGDSAHPLPQRQGRGFEVTGLWIYIAVLSLDKAWPAGAWSNGWPATPARSAMRVKEECAKQQKQALCSCKET